MDTFPFTLAVGATQPIKRVGSFIRCYSLTGGTSPQLRVKTDRGDQVLLRGGQGATLGRGFSELSVTNEEGVGTLTAILLVGEGHFDDDRITGAVTLEGTGGAHVQAKKTVTTASGALLAASSTRRYLLVQNQDAAGNVYLATDGGAATADAECIKLAPGDVWEPAVPPTSAVAAIGDIASNANVQVVEA